MMIVNKTLDHLPTSKREELEAVAAVICRECADVEMVMLFGSYARGDWKDGPHSQGYGRLIIHKKSDYDILVITGRESIARDRDLWERVKHLCGAKASTWVRLIPRDIEFVNDKLMEGQYFFTEIVGQGVFLYNSGHYQLEDRRQLSPQQAREIAQANFDEIFHTAEGFYESAGSVKLDKIAAFMLSQACELAYKTVLLVFANECPQEHHLDVLGHMAADYCPELTGIFPIETAEQRTLFELLDYAYIGARYDRNYKISKAQLEYLTPCVKRLHALVEKYCRDKIASFARGE